MAALPALTSQIAELNKRTKVMEEQIKAPDRLSALSQPLGKSATAGSTAKSPSPASALLKEMPPPAAAGKVRQLELVPTFAEQETLALQQERRGSSEEGDMVKAMFAQSSAITALAAQLANMSGDTMTDLAGTSMGVSSKGATGRMKLQAELAAHRGTFFQAVLMNMSRRMNPASSSEATPQQLLNQGVCLTKYVERFGGFGRSRDMGYVMWQVAMLMDYLQAENWQGARDSAALLAVCLEQTALDGSMDVGLLLSLVEDPPSGLFTNRSLAPLSRGKAFAPLAEQRWITVALQFIKELDVISQRRSDLVSGRPGSSSDPTSVPVPKVKPKPQPKWKKKKKALEDGPLEDA